MEVIYSLKSGGAERITVDLSNELSRMGHDVTLVVFRDDKENSELSFYKEELSKKIKYINLRIKEGFRVSPFIAVHRLVAKRKPEIIHCHLNVIPYFYFIALFGKKVNIFHTLHNVAKYTLSPKQYHFNRFFYSKYKITPIAISDLCNETYRKHYHLDNATTINNGRSPVRRSESFRDVQKEIKTLQKNAQDLVFIHIAHFAKQKNQDLLIDVFNQLFEEGYNFTLLIIGSGFDSENAQELKSKSCSKIKYLGLKENIGDYLFASDAFCLSSAYEGAPISLLEALSAGCLPICTPVGGIPNIIDDEINGYLSKDVSFEEYKKAVLKFINHPKNIPPERLCMHFKENYSIGKCAFEYETLFLREMDPVSMTGHMGEL